VFKGRGGTLGNPKDSVWEHSGRLGKSPPPPVKNPVILGICFTFQGSRWIWWYFTRMRPFTTFFVLRTWHHKHSPKELVVKCTIQVAIHVLIILFFVEIWKEKCFPFEAALHLAEAWIYFWTFFGAGSGLEYSVLIKLFFWLAWFWAFCRTSKILALTTIDEYMKYHPIPPNLTLRISSIIFRNLVLLIWESKMNALHPKFIKTLSNHQAVSCPRLPTSNYNFLESAAVWRCVRMEKRIKGI